MLIMLPNIHIMTTYSKRLNALISTLPQILQRLEHHNFGVSCCIFSPDSALLCTCSWDNTVVLSSPDTAQVLSLLLGHRNPVTSACFDSHGNLVRCCRQLLVVYSCLNRALSSLLITTIVVVHGWNQ